MSILLDALKKSEEQRQLGKAPDIHGPGDHDPRGPGTAPAWVPGAMMAVAAAVIGWLVWQQFSLPDMTAVSGSPEVSQKPAMVAAEEAAEPRPDGQARRTPVESFNANPPAADSSQAPAGESDAQRRELARTFEQYRQPEPEPDAGDAASDVQPTARRGVATRPGTTGQTAATQNRPAAQTPMKPHVPEPIPYWELPQNVRDAMPELNIMVMVFAEEPADRFMLVNGVRLRENEELDGVKLEEIRRDGAVFRYRIYRFLVEG